MASLREWFSLGYGAPEFNRDLHVMVAACASELILDLSGAVTCDFQTCATRLGTIAAITFLKSFAMKTPEAK